MTKRRATVGPAGADARPDVQLNDKGELKLFFPALAVEGLATSDGRTIAPDSLTHRALPISVLAQYRNPGSDGGHSGAEVIGKLDEIWRTPGPEVTSRQTGESFPAGTFVWQGRGTADPETRGGQLAAKGYLTGNSVDLSEIDYDEDFSDEKHRKVTITKGAIAATTLCPIPAFADAYVQIGDELAEDGLPEDLTVLDDDEFGRLFDANPPDRNPAGSGRLLVEALRRHGLEAVTAGGYVDALDGVLVASGTGPSAVHTMVRQYVTMLGNPLPPWRAAELGDECGLCSIEADDEWTEQADGTFSPNVAKRKRAFARGLAIKGDKADGSDASYPIENQGDLDKAVNMRGQGDADKSAVVAHIRKVAAKLKLKVPDSLKAAAAPALPSLALFSDPKLPAYTPIGIGSARGDGRREITGHIATWSSCHASYSDVCVRPPHTRTDYARFMTGAVRVDDSGTPRVAAVGRVSMSNATGIGGHADGHLSESAAVAHYDNTCTAVADVAAGEDAHGIWIHGLTRPELSEADLDRLLASPMSGDWRGHEGNLEMCAVLAVNVPGYVVPRSRVASGVAVSLVAAGMLKPGAEFAPAGGLTLAAIRTVIMSCLMEFFDPDNDGDIDRPMDDQSDDGTGQMPAKVSPPAAKDKGTAGGGEPVGKKAVTASLHGRVDAALREMRAGDALAELGVVVPFAHAGQETSG